MWYQKVPLRDMTQKSLLVSYQKKDQRRMTTTKILRPIFAWNVSFFSSSDFENVDWESHDVTPGIRSKGRMLLRSDSDADLMLGSPSKRQSLSVKMRWCCINCRHATFWQQYWWVPAVLVAVILIYVVLVLVIINTLGKDWRDLWQDMRTEGRPWTICLH